MPCNQKTYKFSIVLHGDCVLNDKLEALLLMRGFDDATISTSNGVLHLDLCHNAASFEQAILEATIGLRNAGLLPTKEQP